MRRDLAAVVDRYWAEVFGCPVDELWPATPMVSAHSGLGDYPGIYALALDEAVRISAPAPMVAELDAMLPAWPGDLLDPRTWRAVLGDRVSVVHGPSAHHYLNVTDGHVGSEVREVSAAQLEPLRSACPAADWGEGGFGEPDGRCFARWKDGHLVAAGNLTVWRGRPSDVGLVTHPDHRGRGYAEEVARHVATVAVQTAGVARYRALTTNVPSLGIARRLGFGEYGRNIAVRLTSPGENAVRHRE